MSKPSAAQTASGVDGCFPFRWSSLYCRLPGKGSGAPPWCPHTGSIGTWRISACSCPGEGASPWHGVSCAELSWSPGLHLPQNTLAAGRRDVKTREEYVAASLRVPGGVGQLRACPSYRPAHTPHQAASLGTSWAVLSALEKGVRGWRGLKGHRGSHGWLAAGFPIPLLNRAHPVPPCISQRRLFGCSNK